MAQSRQEYEMEPRGQRGGAYSRDGGTQYGTDSKDQYGGTQYGMDSGRSQYEGGASEQNSELVDGRGAVTQQPTRMGFPGSPSVPRGLEYMAQVDQLLVHQKHELCEIFTGCEMNNQYTVANSLGQPVYSAMENTNCCTRQCLGQLRPFDLHVQDTYEREVLRLRRPLRCEGCCCPCCLQRLEVTSGDGQLLGSVRERWTLIKPKLTVHGPDGGHAFTIRGPCWTCSCGGDVRFRVLTVEEEREVGVISKQWSGLAREVFTDSDTFGVTFPMELDVPMKATLFGALFLIDFMFFERSSEWGLL